MILRGFISWIHCLPHTCFPRQELSALWESLWPPIGEAAAAPPPVDRRCPECWAWHFRRPQFSLQTFFEDAGAGYERLAASASQEKGIN